MMRRAFLVCLCVVALVAVPAMPGEHDAHDEPVPYDPREFPAWSLKLRRAQIVAVGIFPFALLASGLTYELVRYGAAGFDSRYAPAPFRSPGGEPLTEGETFGVLASAAILSILLAGLDYLLGLSPEAAPASPP